METFPSPQMMPMLSGPRSREEAGHHVIRTHTKMSRDWTFSRPRKLYPGGALREFVATISISQRGVHISEKSRWWASLKTLRLNHMVSKGPLISWPRFKFTVCWMNGYVETVPLNLTQQKGLCFLLKGFCKAAHSSSHKGSPPHCQAYFYGSSPKQVQNSVGLGWALPLAGHWDTICKLSGNSKHCRLSNSLLIFSLSSETF